MMKMIYLLLTIAILFNGCSTTTKVKTKFVQQKQYRHNYDRNNNPTQFRYKPVIGTKQSDTKVMIDMGQWAKIWVKNYKNKNETFVASHSIITKIREPGFISGEDIPRGRRDAVSKTYGSRSFTLRSSDLMYENSGLGNEGVSDAQIKDYVNTYDYSRQTEKVAPQKRKNTLKHDAAIQSYMKKVKKEQQDKKDAIALRSKLQREADAKKAEEDANEKSDAQYNSEEEYKNGGLK